MNEKEIKAMKYDELKEYAAEIGVDIPQHVKKSVLQALVLEAWALDTEEAVEKENKEETTTADAVIPFEEVPKEREDYLAFLDWSTSQMRTGVEIETKAADMGIDLADYGAWVRAKQKTA